MKTNKSIKKKFFYSFILTIMLPLIIFAFSSYYLIGQNIIETTNEHYESIINKVRENIENQMAEIERLAVQYSNLTWVNEIMMVNDLEGRVTTWELYSYNQDLVTLEVISDTFDEIAIVFHGKDLALSSVRLSEMEYFKKYTFYIEGWTDDDWQKIISRKHSQEIIYDIVLASDKVDKREGLLVVNSIPVNVNRSRATIFAFIEYDNIRKEIKDVCLNEDVSVYLMNAQNEPIVSYNDKGNLPGDFVDSLPDTNGEFTSLFALSNYTYIETLPDLGWKIITLVPNSIFIKNAQQMFVILLFVLILTIVVGILLSNFMAKKRYKPLERLLGYFNIKNSSKNKFNEYDYINEKIQSLINQEKELQREVETNRPILINEYLETLISSESAANTDVQKKLEMLGVSFAKKYFCVAVISESQIEDRDMLEKKILSIDHENKINKHICTIGRDMVILLNFEEESFIYDFLDRIESDIIIKSKFGVGNIYSDIYNITVSYKEARVANGYRCLDSAQKIYMYSQVNNEEIFYFYSLDSELKLIEALSSGNYEKACLLIEQMIEKNKLSNVKTYVALNNFFINLELTMLKLINRHNISILVNDNILKDSSNTITEKKEYVLSLAKEICDAINGKKKDSKQVFWTEVKDYINSNYQDNGLSLELVADMFNYNISSFSSEFKKNVGITFIKYLNKIRIEKAIAYIEKGEQFSSASKMVGFNSEDTFRRSFKKHTGTTPSKYFAKK